MGNIFFFFIINSSRTSKVDHFLSSNRDREPFSIKYGNLTYLESYLLVFWFIFSNLYFVDLKKKLYNNKNQKNTLQIVPYKEFFLTYKIKYLMIIHDFL